MPKRTGNRSISLFFQEEQGLRDQLAQTPESLLKHFEEEYGHFDFDPCPPDPSFDGLNVSWGERNYVNPPFREIKSWLTKAIAEWNLGKEIVFLMPIRIHTKYFLDNIQPLIADGSIQMYILRGGVIFKGYKHRAPFGMMYLHFPKKECPTTD